MCDDNGPSRPVFLAFATASEEMTRQIVLEQCVLARNGGNRTTGPGPDVTGIFG